MSESFFQKYNRENMKKGLHYLKRNGLKSTVYKTLERLENGGDASDYSASIQRTRPSAEALNAQRQEKYTHPYKISILVPAYETHPEYLREMIFISNARITRARV